MGEINNFSFQERAELEEKAKNQLYLIVDNLPNHTKDFINQAFQYQRIPKEYLLSSIMFAYSNAAGLAFEFNSLVYSNYANLYFALIGSRGDMKSPAMELATKPLDDLDNLRYQEYQDKVKNASSDSKIERKQWFIQDATIEAAVWAHNTSPYSIGIYNDEIYHLIEKMGNPASKDGPMWRTFFLQGNTNKPIDVIRKTSDNFRIIKSYPVLMGSIQTEFIPKIFAGGNLESGFVDRLLFTTKLTTNNRLTKYKVGLDCSQRYADSLYRLINCRNEMEEAEEGLSSVKIYCLPEAENKLFDYVQNLIDTQESAPDLEKEYISKLQINIHKIVLLIHLMKNAETGDFRQKVQVETVELAIQITEFYFTNYQIIIRHLTPEARVLDVQRIIEIGFHNNATQEEIASVLGVSKSTVCRRIQKIKG